MTRTHAFSFLLLGLLVLSGCSRCSREGAPGQVQASALLKQVPQEVDLALVVPDLGVLGDRLTLLQGLKIASFAAQLQGISSAEAWVNGLVAQLGVDVRSREAMKKAGLAPERGLAVFSSPAGDFVSIIGVNDAKAWEQTVAQLAERRLGARVRTEGTAGGKKLVSFSRAEGSPPVLSIVSLDGFALMAAQRTAANAAPWVLASGKPSLADSPSLQAAQGRLGQTGDAWLFVPPGSTYGRRYTLGGALLALTLAKEAFTVRADLAWPNNVEALAVLQSAKDVVKLAPRLPQDSFAAFRYAGAPALLEPYWPKLAGPYVTRAVRESGFDVKEELLGNLKPGAVLSLELAPAPPLGTGMPQLDLRRTNPFRYVHLTALAEVKDAAKAQGTLEKLPPVAQRFGATLRPEERFGQKIVYTTYSQGEGVHLALKGSTLVAASPVGNLEKLLKAGSESTGLAPEWQTALDAQPLTGVVDLHRLAASVKALPSEAWGVGGFAIKATTVRWLEATDDLRAVTFAAWAKERAVQAELSLRLSK